MKASEFYQLTEKPDSICQVKFCRNQIKKRYGRLCYKHAKALWRANHPEKDAYFNLKNRARQRTISFNLSFKDFLLLFLVKKELSKTGEEYQIDRKEVTRGYYSANLQVITATANRAKQTEEKRKYLEKKIKTSGAKPFPWVMKQTENEFMP